MPERPQPSEASGHYWDYIHQVKSDDVLDVLNEQLDAFSSLANIGEQQSLHRYDPGKWTIRALLNHISDTERVFTFRAFWFARSLEGGMSNFDQDIAATHAAADAVPWAQHVEEFRRVRLATLSLAENLPMEAWDRQGIARGNAVSVRALLFATAGHFAHHRRILDERYGV